MIRQTVKAALTNFNLTYLAAIFLGLAPVAALLNFETDLQLLDLLMSFGIVAAAHLGLIAGTALAEIKVKPLSFALPGQERSMAPAMLLLGTAVCAAYAILVLLRPMSIVEIPAPQQSLAAFGFSLGIFMLVVAVCVVTRDTLYLPLAVIIPGFLLFAAVSTERADSWLTMNATLAESPLLSLLFAALGIGLVYRVLGNRELSRRLCGAPFLPLKAYDNPFKLEDYRSRMRNASFRPSFVTESRSLPGAAWLAMLSRRMAGSAWDYLVLETRMSRNPWEFVFRLVSPLGLFVLGMYAWNVGDRANALSTLFFFSALTFLHFAPTFKPRLSPMLPAGRGQHFRTFVAKGTSVYGLAIVGMLLLQLIAQGLPGSGNQVAVAFAETAELPLKGVLMTAATIPILCWAFASLRSMFAFFLFLLLFFGTVGSMTEHAYESLMRLSYPQVLLISALCWLPFISIAWKRCHSDDLLLP